MQQTVTQIGDSYIFVIPKEIQQKWNLRPSSKLELESQGNSLMLKVVLPPNQLEEALESADENYAETFRSLAQ